MSIAEQLERIVAQNNATADAFPLADGETVFSSKGLARTKELAEELSKRDAADKYSETFKAAEYAVLPGAGDAFKALLEATSRALNAMAEWRVAQMELAAVDPRAVIWPDGPQALESVYVDDAGEHITYALEHAARHIAESVPEALMIVTTREGLEPTDGRKN